VNGSEESQSDRQALALENRIRVQNSDLTHVNAHTRVAKQRQVSDRRAVFTCSLGLGLIFQRLELKSASLSIECPAICRQNCKGNTGEIRSKGRRSREEFDSAGLAVLVK
jgi:hypothetical protein